MVRQLRDQNKSEEENNRASWEYLSNIETKARIDDGIEERVTTNPVLPNPLRASGVSISHNPKTAIEDYITPPMNGRI